MNNTFNEMDEELKNKINAVLNLNLIADFPLSDYNPLQQNTEDTFLVAPGFDWMLVPSSGHKMKKPLLSLFEFFNDESIDLQQLKTRNYILKCPLIKCIYKTEAQNRNTLLRKLKIHLDEQHLDENITGNNTLIKNIATNLDAYIKQFYYYDLIGICPLKCDYYTKPFYDPIDPLGFIKLHLVRSHGYNPDNEITAEYNGNQLIKIIKRIKHQ